MTSKACSRKTYNLSTRMCSSTKECESPLPSCLLTCSLKAVAEGAARVLVVAVVVVVVVAAFVVVRQHCNLLWWSSHGSSPNPRCPVEHAVVAEVSQVTSVVVVVVAVAVAEVFVDSAAVETAAVAAAAAGKLSHCRKNTETVAWYEAETCFDPGCSSRL